MVYFTCMMLVFLDDLLKKHGRETVSMRVCLREGDEKETTRQIPTAHTMAHVTVHITIATDHTMAHVMVHITIATDFRGESPFPQSTVFWSHHRHRLPHRSLHRQHHQARQPRSHLCSPSPAERGNSAPPSSPPDTTQRCVHTRVCVVCGEIPKTCHSRRGRPRAVSRSPDSLRIREIHQVIMDETLNHAPLLLSLSLSLSAPSPPSLSLFHSVSLLHFVFLKSPPPSLFLHSFLFPPFPPSHPESESLNP